MSKKVKNVLIWLPLAPIHNWRGEGIAQTLEHLLLETSNESLYYTILVNPKHYCEAVDIFRKKNNVKVIPLTLTWLFFRFFPQKKYKYVFDSKNQDFSHKIKVDFLDAITTLLKKLKLRLKFDVISLLISLFWYGFKLVIFTIFQRLGFLGKADIIWLPTPIINWSEYLKGKKIQSFWDSFVFEYSEFDDVSLYLFKKYMSLFRKVEYIITQSNNNKNYLVQVFGIPEDKIAVIYNGSPDYSKVLNDTNFDTKDKIFKIWEKRSIKALSYTEFISRLHHEYINHSVIFRLMKRINSKTKIVLISTQYRIYKGFGALFKIIDKVIQIDPNVYFIFTSKIPRKIKEKYFHLHENIFEITRVSNKQHAMLYCLSDLVLHPSYTEGGLGSYPQFEAASLNRPCLVNRGPHTDELCSVFGKKMEKVVCDFTNIEYTVSKIIDILSNPSAREENIQINSSAYIDWKDVAKKYENLFLKLIEHD